MNEFAYHVLPEQELEHDQPGGNGPASAQEALELVLRPVPPARQVLAEDGPEADQGHGEGEPPEKEPRPRRFERARDRPGGRGPIQSRIPSPTASVTVRKAAPAASHRVTRVSLGPGSRPHAALVGRVGILPRHQPLGCGALAMLIPQQQIGGARGDLTPHP
ncbi:MAG: hypothetical protein ACREYE_18970, partial [Gammaproteobacteria bacterium]